MSRRGTWLAAVLALIPMMLAASAASALEFSVLGPAMVTVAPGEPFKIDIALDNALEETVAAITSTLSGLGAAGAVVTGGQTASMHLAGVCLPPPTGCIGGLDPPNGPFFDPNDLSRHSYSPGDDSLVIVNVIGLQAVSYDGSIDPGLDGALTEPSPRDVTVELVAWTLGLHVLTIGGAFSDGSSTLPIENDAAFTVRVIPEPATSLLLALGLWVLAVPRLRPSCSPR